MNIARKIYRFINNLSIDVSLGAVTCAWFFSRIMHVNIRLQGLAALGITVWVIYTLDHLLDALKTKHRASTERHRFHQRNFKILAGLCAIAALLDMTFIFYLRAAVLKAGILLGLLVGIYLLINRRLRFMKEIAGAIFYTGGVVMPALVLSHFDLNQFRVFLIIQFMLTALLNMLLFSLLDRPNDEADSRMSFTTTMGERNARISIYFLFLMCLAIALYQLVMFFDLAVVIVILMDMMLFIIFIFSRYFAVGDRYRFAGDAVFLLPLLYTLA